MSFKCPLCDKKYDKILSLSIHFRKGHKSTSEKLYTLLYHNGQRPTCGCGCNSEVKFLGIKAGFREFILGHAAKIPGKNNWGNNRDVQEKSQATRKKMWQDGKLKIWNKGQTKKTHPSVAKYGKSGSKTIRSSKSEIKTRSENV
jgi:hypothetical protein